MNICRFYSFSSAWIKSDDIYDFIQNINKFSTKNKSKKFREAIQQANEAASKQTQQNTESVQNALQLDPKGENGATVSSLSNCKITLKEKEIGDLLKTFEENEVALRSIFVERQKNLDHFNKGCGYDYVSVLARLATSKQQQQMYSYMCEALAGKNYFEKAIHENLFWTIILPEWLIAICVKQLSCSKEQIIAQIKKNDEDSFNANNTFNLSSD